MHCPSETITNFSDRKKCYDDGTTGFGVNALSFIAGSHNLGGRRDKYADIKTLATVSVFRKPGITLMFGENARKPWNTTMPPGTGMECGSWHKVTSMPNRYEDKYGGPVWPRHKTNTSCNTVYVDGHGKALFGLKFDEIEKEYLNTFDNMGKGGRGYNAWSRSGVSDFPGF